MDRGLTSHPSVFCAQVCLRMGKRLPGHRLHSQFGYHQSEGNCRHKHIWPWPPDLGRRWLHNSASGTIKILRRGGTSDIQHQKKHHLSLFQHRLVKGLTLTLDSTESLKFCHFGSTYYSNRFPLWINTLHGFGCTLYGVGLYALFLKHNCICDKRWYSCASMLDCKSPCMRHKRVTFEVIILKLLSLQHYIKHYIVIHRHKACSKLSSWFHFSFPRRRAHSLCWQTWLWPRTKHKRTVQRYCDGRDDFQF